MTLKVADLKSTNNIFYSCQSCECKPKEISVLHKECINNLYLLTLLRPIHYVKFARGLEEIIQHFPALYKISSQKLLSNCHILKTVVPS